MNLIRRSIRISHAATRLTAAALIGSFVMASSTFSGARVHAEPSQTPVSITVFGDSLTAGYSLQPAESFPAQLQMALQDKGHKVQIVNAGVSGDTSASGLDRLAWTLQPLPDAIIVELGANDALRGADPKKTRDNLDQILTKLSASGIPVLLAGMKAPGNWGADYVQAFDTIYPDLARKHSVPLYPFFLDGVALDPKLVMTDGMHPTAQGIAEIVKRILPEAEALVARAIARKATAKN